MLYTLAVGINILSPEIIGGIIIGIIVFVTIAIKLSRIW